MICGIDNGLDGGAVLLDDRGKVTFRVVTPVIGRKADGRRQYDIPAMVETIKVFRDLAGAGLTAFLERAQAMPGQGVTSMFSTGFGFGVWQGVLTAMGVTFEVVRPQEWQGVVFSGVRAATTKRASAIVAARLSPATDWRRTEKCEVPHDGLTDAFCIAEYGRRKLKALL